MAGEMASRINKNPNDPARQLLRALLRSLRERAQLRQEDLAARLGKPQSFVSKYEGGERRLDVIDTREICRAMGLSLTQFSESLESELMGLDRKTVRQNRRGRR